MKKLNLCTANYQRLEIAFKNWMNTLGYATITAYRTSIMLREYLYWLEKNNITIIKTVTREHVSLYLDYISKRKKEQGAGCLSITSINNYIYTINLFSKYLLKTGQAKETIRLSYIKKDRLSSKTILTEEEIKQLYRATDDTMFGIRNRAMLTVYYGCGLRRSEGISLNISDVLFERKLLYVRNPKNNYERYVPITKTGLKYLKEYIYEGRPLLLSKTSNPALFLSMNGNRISYHAMLMSIKKLVKKTGNLILQQKAPRLHTLRHSIATHLLQKNMNIENIALFLGHRCLDSTQVYTHIINEL